MYYIILLMDIDFKKLCGTPKITENMPAKTLFTEHSCCRIGN